MGREAVKVIEAAPYVDAHPTHEEVAEDVGGREAAAEKLRDGRGRLGLQLVLVPQSARSGNGSAAVQLSQYDGSSEGSWVTTHGVVE